MVFLVSENENRILEDLPPSELHFYLSRFVLSVRKKSGEEYEPSTPSLRELISSVYRCLKKHCYSDSIMTGKAFAKNRDALKSKQKQLKRLGKGSKPQEASSLNQGEIDTLFSRGAMGIHSPQVLMNTLRHGSITVYTSDCEVEKNNETLIREILSSEKDSTRKEYFD